MSTGKDVSIFQQLLVHVTMFAMLFYNKISIKHVKYKDVLRAQSVISIVIKNVLEEQLLCCQTIQMCILFIFYLILFIFRERGREGEREGEKHQCVVVSPMPPTGDLARIPGMCPDLESNQRPFGSQPTLNPLSYTSQGQMHILY